MNKRTFLKAAGGLLAAAPALGLRNAVAAETDSCGRVANPLTFLLLHGAWGGGFYLEPMAEVLRREGHRVFVPTLTGQGERMHLLSRDVNLSTHITDVLNVFKYEKLSDVVLVGHSYGGYVITSVADRIPDKIRSIVFFDAFIPEDGKSFAEQQGQAKELQALWDKGEDGYPVPPNSTAEDRTRRVGPHPLGALLEKAHITGAWLQIPKKTYVMATATQPTVFTKFYNARKDDPAWKTLTIDSNHGFPQSHAKEAAAFAENSI